MKKSAIHLIILYMAIVLAACSSRPNYRISVLQCSEGNWRYKLNKEILAAQHLYDEHIEVEILNCHDLSQVQVRQIDSLTAAGVDLLVVAPNEYNEVAAALRRTKERGIPVILFDRKAESEDYTAFIGGDNVGVGRQAADYAALLSANGGKSVVEIAALQSTSPARDRHAGFEAGMRQHPDISYRCIYGDWDDHHTGAIVAKLLKEAAAAGSAGTVPDVIFCHSDFMATGAWRAVKAARMEKRVQIIGVDGLPGPGEGIEAVQQGRQAATCIYPTHGEQIVKLALDILEGRPYQRENILQGMVVTPDNVGMIARYSEELVKQGEELTTITSKLEQYFGLYHLQVKLLWGAALVIVMLFVAIALTWNAVRQTRRAHRQMQQLSDEQTLFYTNASHQLKTPLTLIAGPIGQLCERHVLTGDDAEMLDIAMRNIGQMETVLSSVVNFRKDGSVTAIADDTSEELKKQAAAAILEQEHLNMMKQEDSEELSDILIVDDNADMRRYLRTLLASRFYVLEAPDGQSGLRLARESVPDLIISDVMMPVMDGLQLCQALKDDFITSHIPVILLTARSTEAQQMEGYEHGADAYLAKPFRADLLVSRIDNLLHNRQRLRASLQQDAWSMEPKAGDQPGARAKQQATTQDKLFLDQLKEAINRRMSDPNLKMDDLGEEMGISRVQLYRKVKVLTGLSPVELLRQLRLERGKTLLSTTTRTIAEIAYEVGFSTPSYFSTCFKKQFGKLPMDFRA